MPDKPVKGYKSFTARRWTGWNRCVQLAKAYGPCRLAGAAQIPGIDDNGDKCIPFKHASSMRVIMHEVAHPAAIGSRINLYNQEAER